jgi:hypothetical protein
METTRQIMTVLTPLPVQFSATRNGNDITIFNVTVGGLTSMFDLLNEEAKHVIIECCARHARGIK